jgi:uncharacterized glyoxalase superfamily protein PhnB
MKPLSYIPEGHNSVSPYLMVEDIDSVTGFLIKTFGAQLLERMLDTDGKARHAEVKIGDSVVMMGRAREDYPAMPCMVHVYCEDVDSAYLRAMGAGGETLMAPTDQFYGNREAGVKGPGGIQWWMATRIEEVSEEELLRRASE